jgi:hypothetical protein
MAVGLKGVQQKRTISDTFVQKTTGQSLVSLQSLNLIIGSGGGLSHAPKRMQAALMLIDAWLPEGITEIAVDSIFMMPHLGVLATVHEKAAMEVFEKDCLVRLGSCIAPVGTGKDGSPCVCVKIGDTEKKVNFGDIAVLPLEEKAEAEITPERGFDVGEGRGKKVIQEIKGGEVGIIIDARGRPFKLPESKKERISKLGKWFDALEVY